MARPRAIISADSLRSSGCNLSRQVGCPAADIQHAFTGLRLEQREDIATQLGDEIQFVIIRVCLPLVIGSRL
ncbi:hypothetical protein [Paenibacillus sp. FSL R7-0333]|uniref:hypothetical protein n=1 Tax=Paenibacillus sp. FSL R7-0333 TaxID=1926587 RepID=UPI0030FB53EA